jgi:hypothetical protein
VPESFESLRQKLLELMNSARERTPEHRKGFWYYRPLENFPPKTIRIPEEFDGSEEIAIACTQTELGAKAQRELVARWCRVLPTLSVRHVWLQTKTPQQLLEAACDVPSLESLNVSWSSVTDLSALTRAPQLRHLKVGSCPSAPNLSGIEGLTHLRWLEFALPHAVSSLDSVAQLTELEGLSVTSGSKRQSLPSFRPLSGLNKLRWLHIGGIRTDDKSLQPLKTLKALKFLAIGNLFPMAEFARLSRQLPETDCDWFVPGRATGSCRQCKSERVMISGKGVSSICPTCNPAKWDKIVEAFIAASETSWAENVDV